jgi:predicted MFS family arabinose efflux permease
VWAPLSHPHCHTPVTPRWSGVVIAMMCVASILGGIVHGAARKSIPQLGLVALLSALTIPVVLVSQPWWLLALVLFPANMVCTPVLTSTAEAVSDLAPSTVRGEAMGLVDSSLRMGLALGSPVVGFVVDHSRGAWGFAAAGFGGLIIAALSLAFVRAPVRRRNRNVSQTT